MPTITNEFIVIEDLETMSKNRKNRPPLRPQPTLQTLQFAGDTGDCGGCVSEDRVNLLIAMAISECKKEDRESREAMHKENQSQFEVLKNFMNKILGALTFLAAVGIPALVVDMIFRVKGTH